MQYDNDLFVDYVDKILLLVDDEDKDVSKSALSNLSKILQ